MTTQQKRARVYGVAFLVFALGAVVLDLGGALRTEHPVSIRIAEIAPAAAGLFLLAFSASRR